MEAIEVSPGVIAFIRPDEGANAGLIHTAEGAIVVDTTSSPSDMQALLEEAGVQAAGVRLVINTHAHSDHTWGNQVFDAPILAHRLCRERMAELLDEGWNREAIEGYLAELEQSDPEKAREMSDRWADLNITLPTEVFDERWQAEIGDVRLEVIHFDAHSPGSSVVWLPEPHVMFAADLIFEGRYPFLLDADVQALIAALKRLLAFGAHVIVPGHGKLCGEPEVTRLIDYLLATWERTAEHVAQEHDVEEIVADVGYPRYAEGQAERLHETNIRVMYAQIVASDERSD